MGLNGRQMEDAVQAETVVQGIASGMVYSIEHRA